MKKPDFIYFDIDDTLLDHMSAQQAALESVYHKFPILAQVPLVDFQIAYKKINTALWERYSLGEINRAYLEEHRFIDTFDSLEISCHSIHEVASFYLNDYRSHWSWIEGAEKALVELSKVYGIGFITNGFKETQRLKALDFQFNRFSETIIISEEVGYLKPHPEIFNYAQEKACVHNEAILYVGDSLSSDVIGGKSVGWQVAWFTSQQKTVINHPADFVFSSFQQLVEELI